MNLHHFEMPISFSGRALLFGAKSNIFNPSQKIPNSISGICLSVPKVLVVHTIHTIYRIAIAILAPFGAIYHLVKALACWLESKIWHGKTARERFAVLAWEHLKASYHDLCYVIKLEPVTHFCSILEESVRTQLSSSLVKVAPLHSTEVQQFMNQFSSQSVHSQFNENLKNMCNGLYKFNQVVYRALLLRSNQIGSMPSISSREVRQVCFNASMSGTY